MSTQRRTRYTVVFADGSKKAVRAYSNFDARFHYEQQGLIPVSVIKGDYRKMEAKAEAFKNGGYCVDKKALDAAIAELGLEWPVKIRKSNHYAFVAGRQGSHIAKTINTVLTHDIMIKSYLDPEKASFTLWHELTHARQAEQAAEVDGYFGYLTEKRLQQARYSYSRRPWEIEANKVADEHKDSPLCY